MDKTGPEAVAESELIKEVTGDDDLDMSTLGKPISSLKPVKQADEPVQQAEAPDATAPVDTKKKEKSKPSKEKKEKKEKTKRATEALWSQLDKEIEDVSDDEVDGLTTPINLNTEPTSPVTESEKPLDPRPSERRRGVIAGGLSGGTSLGANAPMKEGPKDHSYDIVDGEAKARVYDTPELRGAFLFYCKSSIKVSEMHLVHEGPFMAAQQFVQMCKDYKLLEPDGKLSFVMVGIIYTTSKSDDDEGMAFGQFLDSLVSLAFECETNFAGQLQADWDKKDVLNKAGKAAEVRQPRRASVAQLRSSSAPGAAGSEGEQSGTATPGTGASTPGGETTSQLTRCGSRFHEILDNEGANVPVIKKKEKTRFQGVENMTNSSVLDKVNEVSKIKSMATSRATSVINSRVTSRMVSHLPSRRASEDGSDEEDAEQPAQGPVAAATGYAISPTFLSTHVHAALEGYEGYTGNAPDESGAGSPHAGKTVLGPDGEAISPLFAVGNGRGPRGPNSGGGAPSLRPTTANRLKASGTADSAAPKLVLPRDAVTRSSAENGNDGEQRSSANGKPPAPIQQRASSNGSDASISLQGKGSLKSALSPKTKITETAPFGSPVGSMRARFASSSENGALTASGHLAAAAAAAAVAAADAAAVPELPLLAPDLSKEVNTQMWSEWAAQGNQGEPSKEWIAANATKYTDGTAASSSALGNVSRTLTVQDGSVAITAQRKTKGSKQPPAAAAAEAPTEAANGGRRDSLAGDAGASGAAGDKALSPYELQLAKLEAKYKKGGAAAVAVPPSDAAAGDKPRSARGSMSGSAGPAWRPAGKESMTASGKLKIDARITSGRQGRASGTGEAAPSPKGNAKDAANVLKSTLLAAQASADLAEPDSPTAHLEHLPTGEALSPNASLAAAASKKAASGRQPVLMNSDQMAMMASFGQSAVANTAAVAPAPPAAEGAAAATGAAAAEGESKAEDDKFSFAQKRRAEMEAKLALIEQRLAPGKPGELQKPTPPSGPPPNASPRSSITAVKKQAAA